MSVTSALLLLLTVGLPSATVAEEGVDIESSPAVLLDRHNTVGGWEIYASLVREPVSDKTWIELYVIDYGNMGKKTLEIPHVDFEVDGESLHVECGDAADAELFGGGLVIKNTRSAHVCALETSEFDVLRAARKIESALEVEGKDRKPRVWHAKAVGKLKTLTRRKA